MARRPTIPDLAKAAGVSVATVNRVLADQGNVRPATMDRVLSAARDIGFYGIRSIEGAVSEARPKDRFAVLLQQPGRPFYEAVGQQLREAAKSFQSRDVDLSVVFMNDISPDAVAETIISRAEEAEALAVVAADHPLVRDAIEQVVAGGTPVIAMIAPINANCTVGFVGLDNYKVGRTAGWAFDRMCRTRGKIGVLVGNHRYRNQDLNESGFRSYCREFAPEFTILEPLTTYETSAVAREVTETLLKEHPDLSGLFISGGGITGAISAIRDAGRSGDFVAVGYELFPQTKAALIDGTLTMVIHHPLSDLARETIAGLIRAKTAGAGAGSQRSLLEFQIYTRENI